MNKTNSLSILAILLISSFSASLVYLQIEDTGFFKVFASSTLSSSSNTSNEVTEGNSTYSNSTQGDDQGVSKVIVIPNPNQSSPASQNDSVFIDSTNTALQNNENNIISQDGTNAQHSSNSINSNNSNSSNQNEMQRGEYKVDNNGIHYYNINNCSLVKGSSGIGDLSECEDAEREIQEELTG
ncbi:hypothetical protein [Candidatus Nitrosocosmicus hydrocola]|uniref:hypothetical protein n=1 Tax=Candidatus Nitrosocosmicus hydrocola TaxID=1826872 RepID=UPI0011E5F233|nr:hypothetical protein [Candidatus Nitrosocosmicus hydrocola]